MTTMAPARASLGSYWRRHRGGLGPLIRAYSPIMWGWVGACVGGGLSRTSSHLRLKANKGSRPEGRIEGIGEALGGKKCQVDLTDNLAPGMVEHQIGLLEVNPLMSTRWQPGFAFTFYPD